MSEAYLKIRFLELEVVQANAKVARVSTKKLDDVSSSQKHFSDKFGLGYTGESSSADKITKEVRFVQAKELIVVASTPKKVKNEKKKNVADQWVLNKPRNQSVIKLLVRGKSSKITKRFENEPFLPSLWTSRTYQTKLS